MANTTYVPIETYTLGSAANSVTFGSGGTIPQTYTDLIIVCNFSASSSNVVTPSIRFNGDTGSNYSNTTLYGIGSGSGTAVGYTNQNKSFLGDFSAGVTTYAPDPYIIQVMNYSNSTTYKTFLTRYNQINSSTGEVGATVGLWRNTNAITSITILSDGGQNYAVGSIFTLYGISNAGQSSPKANGGNVYSDSTYWYHAFPMSGNFIPNQSITADILCIGGGGGGGYGRAGGGGAGGYVYSTSQSLTTTSYTVVVGGGGFATSSGNGTVGNDSSVTGSGFTTITAGGGGYGGDTGTAGGNGGSGGGGGGNNTGGGSATGVGTGNAGGGGVYNSSYGRAGGGGGGAGGAGAAGSSPGSGGNGGIGIQNSAFASATNTGVGGYYAGGGGGGAAIAGATVATGGSGTGGNGGTDSPATVVQATNGVIYTGGGGGGGGGSAGNGGSGIVIIRYPKA